MVADMFHDGQYKSHDRSIIQSPWTSRHLKQTTSFVYKMMKCRTYNSGDPLLTCYGCVTDDQCFHCVCLDALE